MPGRLILDTLKKLVCNESPKITTSLYETGNELEMETVLQCTVTREVSRVSRVEHHCEKLKYVIDTT